MKKFFLMGAVLMLGTALTFAQDTNSTASQSGASASTQSTPTDSSSQTGTTTTTQQTTTTTEQSSTGNAIQGCLSGSTGNWMLRTNTGETYKLTGSDSQLSDNANKQVEVMGTPGSTATASASNNPDNSASAGTANGTAEAGSAHATASTAKTLEVSSVRKIADTCSTANGSQTAPQQ
jgi:hypothetical protein